MNSLANQRLLRFLWRDLVGSGTLRTLWVFCACLFLGILLIAASSGLLRMVEDGMSARQQAVFGGDLIFSQRQPLSQQEQDWLTANADVSRLIELRTMLGTEDDEFTVVELQSVDDQYPLYGSVELAPAMPLAEAVSRSQEGQWGAVFDPVLATTHGLEVGQKVYVGSLELELRAAIVEQPDRSLTATTRGPPLLIDEGALLASGLIGPMSLVDYDYRVRTDTAVDDLRRQFRAAFPASTVEIRTLADRSELISRRLDQVASVLLLIGLTTLFIGGLGVANSIAAWIATKRATLATLQALGARQAQITLVFVGQVLLLALLSSAAGALVGSALAWLASGLLANALPLAHTAQSLLLPALLATAFGVLAALTFALPNLGRTLAADPVRLLRGDTADVALLSSGFRRATVSLILGTLATMLLLVPEPLVAVVFLAVVGVLVLVLEGLMRGLRSAAKALPRWRVVRRGFAMKIAAANLHRPGNSLRPMLLSLGSALTLLTAAGLVILTTTASLNETVPERAPALVFYDIPAAQRDTFADTLRESPGFERSSLAPLVLGRLTHVNNEPLLERGGEVAEEANDEHKLSYRADGVDNTRVERGEWWPDDYSGPPLVAFEDREADQSGLQVGDKLTFSIRGKQVEATLSAIYSQARFETQFWLEGVFSAGVLDPFITRYVGSAHFSAEQELAAIRSLAERFPNVVTIRTAVLLENARNMLRGAGLAVGLVGVVSLLASLLVMSSVIAATTQRRVYETAIMHAVGARHGALQSALLLEYILMALILTVFASAAGCAIAWAVLVFWLKLPLDGLLTNGLVIAAAGSVLCLTGGALWLISNLRPSPANLLRRGA